jgi:hypothetical protein
VKEIGLERRLPVFSLCRISNSSADFEGVLPDFGRNKDRPRREENETNGEVARDDGIEIEGEFVGGFTKAGGRSYRCDKRKGRAECPASCG